MLLMAMQCADELLIKNDETCWLSTEQVFSRIARPAALSICPEFHTSQPEYHSIVQYKLRQILMLYSRVGSEDLDNGSNYRDPIDWLARCQFLLAELASNSGDSRMKDFEDIIEKYKVLIMAFGTSALAESMRNRSLDVTDKQMSLWYDYTSSHTASDLEQVLLSAKLQNAGL